MYYALVVQRVRQCEKKHNYHKVTSAASIRMYHRVVTDHHILASKM